MIDEPKTTEEATKPRRTYTRRTRTVADPASAQLATVEEKPHARRGRPRKT